MRCLKLFSSESRAWETVLVQVVNLIRLNQGCSYNWDCIMVQINSVKNYHSVLPSRTHVCYPHTHNDTCKIKFEIICLGGKRVICLLISCPFVTIHPVYVTTFTVQFLNTQKSSSFHRLRPQRSSCPESQRKPATGSSWDLVLSSCIS